MAAKIVEPDPLLLNSMVLMFSPCPAKSIRSQDYIGDHVRGYLEWLVVNGPAGSRGTNGDRSKSIAKVFLTIPLLLYSITDRVLYGASLEATVGKFTTDNLRSAATTRALSRTLPPPAPTIVRARN